MNHYPYPKLASHTGKVAVVTGAARGLGQAIARGLAERGAAVVGVDIGDLTETEKLADAAGASWLGLHADVTSEADAAKIAAQVEARFGRCDILVNNVGILGGPGWDDLDLETWRRFFSVNVDSQFIMAKALVPMMKARSWGRIVNITSDSTQLPTVGGTAYKSSKMAVIGFTRALAGALAQYGITVNAASPSLTRTPAVMAGSGEPRLQAVAQTQLIQRIAVPDDVVGTILFLTSDDSYFVTGQTLYANGGAHFR